MAKVKIKKTKEQKAFEKAIKDGLTQLIELPCPDWLTPEIYSDYLKNFEEHKKGFNLMSSLQELFPNENQNRWVYNQSWNSWKFTVSPKFLVERYEAIIRTFISTPDSGQDTKTYSEENKMIAAEHAGNHWGWKTMIAADGESIIPNSPSQWLQECTFNIVRISGHLVIVPANCEHRMWGIIGFPLGLVPLESEYNLWFYHPELKQSICSETNQIVNRIKVNGMYIHDIVAECAKQGVSITDESIKTRFYLNMLPCEFLPMYSQPDGEYFFRTINKSSAKTPAQLFHATSYLTQYWIKDFTSPKVTNFSASNKHMHPLYEGMSDKKKASLEAMMIAHVILQFNLNNRNFITMSDKTLINEFKSNEDAHNISDEFKAQIMKDHDFLYSLISKVDGLAITKELSQQLLHMNDVFESMGKIISDKTLLMNEFVDWFDANQKDDDGKMTLLADHWRKATPDRQIKAWGIIQDEFLNGFNTNRLEELGVVSKSSSLPRGFDKDVIKASYVKQNKKDVDGKLFVNPVGAHIIPEMELVRMTESQRDKAFQEEGLGDKFDFNSNCVATSSYHNNRMGVLRISEYTPIMHDEKLVKEARLEKYYKLKAMPILT